MRRWVFSLRNGATGPEEKFPRHRPVNKARRESSPQSGEVENVRGLRADTLFAVRYLLPKNSVETFHLLFPDPWPKRRHQFRRLSRATFWSNRRCAGETRILRVATDQLDYFNQIQRLSRAHLQFQAVAPSLRDAVLPVTKFERKFRAQGVAIHWLELRKISPVR